MVRQLKQDVDLLLKDGVDRLDVLSLGHYVVDAFQNQLNHFVVFFVKGLTTLGAQLSQSLNAFFFAHGAVLLQLLLLGFHVEFLPRVQKLVEKTEVNPQELGAHRSLTGGVHRCKFIEEAHAVDPVTRFSARPAQENKQLTQDQ